MFPGCLSVLVSFKLAVFMESDVKDSIRNSIWDNKGKRDTESHCIHCKEKKAIYKK